MTGRETWRCHCCRVRASLARVLHANRTYASGMRIARLSDAERRNLNKKPGWTASTCVTAKTGTSDHDNILLFLYLCWYTFVLLSVLLTSLASFSVLERLVDPQVERLLGCVMAGGIGVMWWRAVGGIDVHLVIVLEAAGCVGCRHAVSVAALVAHVILLIRFIVFSGHQKRFIFDQIKTVMILPNIPFRHQIRNLGVAQPLHLIPLLEVDFALVKASLEGDFVKVPPVRYGDEIQGSNLEESPLKHIVATNKSVF